MCAFHLSIDHDAYTCADMIRYRNMVDKKEKKIEYPKSEDDHAPCSDSENYFLEYELDSEVGGDYFGIIEGP